MKYLPLTLLAVSFIGLPPPRTEASTITIVDTLGIATPTTQFSVGNSIANALTQSLFGPLFTLPTRSLITEIGGFVETCIECPEPPLPARVEIYRELNGAPDLGTVLASFILSNDGNARVWSYESVAPNLLLGRGSYFALFGTQLPGPQQPGHSGGVLTDAHEPFVYHSALTVMAQTNTITGTSTVAPNNGAVRILAVPVPEPSTLLLLGSGLTGLIFQRRRKSTLGRQRESNQR